MKITTIGYWGAYPAQNSATSSYLVEDQGYRLLVDCGSGALSRLQGYISLNSLDAVIISHYHHDHVADIGVLQHARLVQTKLGHVEGELPIYGHEEDENGFERLSSSYTKAHPYDPESSVSIGPFTISFLKTVHPVPCYGMKITNGDDTIVYTADTAYQKEWIDFSKGADLLITDTNFYKGMDAAQAGHMTSEEAASIAAGAEVEELWLSHLPHFGNHSRLKQEAADVFHGEVKLATEGLRWSSE
ncbi:MBL fold metallo-hydrolase [Salimicrobium halophilum]|uniref:Ribonuclease BN, tRNA processing enzyme n=1 Tax=Salimicrobium halophilum TaxID=86666 RepID=A0A1G8TQ81_9BACI|nr:MBL fold metallo-hydrolase [Salimicrobium halophilum]SDJ43699.1 Ribonuclease BN, tRNA processing enzyme [Salimicrobium halophilum]